MSSASTDFTCEIGQQNAKAKGLTSAETFDVSEWFIHNERGLRLEYIE